MSIQPGPPEPLAGSFIEPMGWRLPVVYYPGLSLEDALRRWAEDAGAVSMGAIERFPGGAAAMLHWGRDLQPGTEHRAYLALPLSARYEAEDGAQIITAKAEGE